MSAYSRRYALRFVLPSVLLGAALWFFPAPAHADATLTYNAPAPPEQEAFNDEGEGYITIDFQLAGKSGSVRLVTGTAQTISVSGSTLSSNGQYEGDDEMLSLPHTFTIGGMTQTLPQTDELSGQVGSTTTQAKVDIAAGPTVTYDLGTVGQVDVTPQEYVYDTSSGGSPPAFLYTVLLRKAATPPASVTASPSSVTYPASATGTVTLTRGAPPGGETLVLSSSSPAASVPATLAVPAGATSATFPITTSRVDADTTVTFTAKTASTTVTGTFTVKTRPETTFSYSVTDVANQHYQDDPDDPNAILNFSVPGGTGSVGLALNTPYTVNIGSYNLSASLSYQGYLVLQNVPFTRALTLGGQTQRLNQAIQYLNLSTDSDDDARYDVDITAPPSLVYDLGAQGRVQVDVPGLDTSFPPSQTPIGFTFTLLPPAVAPSGVTIGPGKVYGLATAYGKVNLPSAAPTGGETVSLVSSDTGAATVPASVSVPAGNKSAFFAITTDKVDDDTPVTITATAGGASKSATLTVLARYDASGTVTKSGAGLNGVLVSAVSTGSFVLTSTATPAVSIPDNNATGITSTLVPKGTGTINSLVVGMDITHPHVGDLIVKITGPDGTSVLLQNKNGNSQHNILTAYPSLTAPIDSLSAFTGKQMAGTWTLSVVDAATGNVGTLNSWSLTFGYSGTYTSSGTTASDGTYSVPSLKEGTYTFTPSLSGYVFSPVSRTAKAGPSVSPPSPVDLNFTATAH